MLRLESPNLHEIGLDRVIAYGHTWSPMHELVPETPLRHGHAISIDMAYSATLANYLGLLSDEEHRRLLDLFSKAGLSIDHPQFDEKILDKGTTAILGTRDGKLRLAVPSPLGKCVFINDYTLEQLNAALAKHKQLVKEYPRQGAGLEAYVDSSDTGYTDNETANLKAEKTANNVEHASKAQKVNGSLHDLINGAEQRNGFHKSIPGLVDGIANGHSNGNVV